MSLPMTAASPPINWRASGSVPARTCAWSRPLSSSESGELEGSLPDLPDLDWEDFERGSELARRDLAGA